MKRRSRKRSIEQPPSAKLDKIKLIFALLLFIALLSTQLFPHAGIRYELGLAILGNLFFLHDGIKKVIEARKSQQRILWYKEPGILYGLAVLLGVLPRFLLDNFLSDIVPNASSIKHIAEVVFNGVTLIFLASRYVFLY